MGSQVLPLWITILCAAQVIYSTGSVLTVRETKEGVNEVNSSSSYTSQKVETYELVENATYSSTSILVVKTTTKTETDFGNNTSEETMSQPRISPSAENTAEPSAFPYGFSSEITTVEELPQTKESTRETTNSEMTEPSMKSTITNLYATTVSLESLEDLEDKCIPDNCTSPDHCTFVKTSGCIRLREGDMGKILYYTIMVPTESSLIYVEMGKEAEGLFPESTITIDFKDCGKENEIWRMEAGKPIQNKNYVSAGPSVTLTISTEESWANFTVHYRELEFQSLVEKVSDSLDAGILDPPTFEGVLHCRPNTRRTYLLTASKSKWNESSVLMTLSFTDLDELAGDYLLIGAGKYPFVGPHPLFFTGQVRKSRDYYIASDDVYVVFASGRSQRTNKKGFHIKWKRSGTAITKPEEEPDEETITDSVQQSVGICFYNKSFISEFNRTDDYNGPLQSFRDKLASTANDYAKRRNIDAMLTASSVEIFRISSIMEPREDVMPEGGIYAMVTIVQHFDRKTAVFRRYQLEEIMGQLEKKDEETGYSMLGFKVGRCPTVESYFQWYLAAVLLVIISSLVLITVWICSSLTKWRGFSRDQEFPQTAVKKFSQSVCYKELGVPARENEYIKYIPGFGKPQLRLTTCDGDSATLDSDSLNQCKSENDDASDRVIFDQSWLMKKRPSRKELPLSLMANTDSEPNRPFLQTFAAPVPTPRNKGSGRLWRDIQMDSLLPQETLQALDHEYDSLVFPNSACLKKDEGETKL